MARSRLIIRFHTEPVLIYCPLLMKAHDWHEALEFLDKHGFIRLVWAFGGVAQICLRHKENHHG